MKHGREVNIALSITWKNTNAMRVMVLWHLYSEIRSAGNIAVSTNWENTPEIV